MERMCVGRYVNCIQCIIDGETVLVSMLTYRACALSIERPCLSVCHGVPVDCRTPCASQYAMVCLWIVRPFVFVSMPAGACGLSDPLCLSECQLVPVDCLAPCACQYGIV